MNRPSQWIPGVTSCRIALARYKRRRGRRIEGAFTMRFPFPADDPAVPAEPSPAALAVATAVADMLQEKWSGPSWLSRRSRDRRAAIGILAAAAAESFLRYRRIAASRVDLVLAAPARCEEVAPHHLSIPIPGRNQSGKSSHFHGSTLSLWKRNIVSLIPSLPRCRASSMCRKNLEARRRSSMACSLIYPDAAKFEARSRPRRASLSACHGFSADVMPAPSTWPLLAVAAAVFAAVAFKFLPELPPAKLLALGCGHSDGRAVERIPVSVRRLCGKDPGHDGGKNSAAHLQRQIAKDEAAATPRAEPFSVVALAGDGPDVGICRCRRPLLARPPKPNLS